MTLLRCGTVVVRKPDEHCIVLMAEFYIGFGRVKASDSGCRTRCLCSCFALALTLLPLITKCPVLGDKVGVSGLWSSL